MTYLNIQQGNTQERVSSAVIDKLYRLALTSNVEDVQNELQMSLSGNIKPSAAYFDAVEYLRNKFPDLLIDIDIRDCYIRFKDPEFAEVAIAKVQSDNVAQGDGIGVTLRQASLITDLGNAFRNNINVTDLTDLLYFNSSIIDFTNIMHHNYNSSTPNDSIDVEPGTWNSPNIFLTVDIKMPQSSTINFRLYMFGVSNGLFKLRINSCDWGNSSAHGTMYSPSYYTYNTIYNNCVFTEWNDNLIPKLASFRIENTHFMNFRGCILDKCIFREGITELDDNFSGCVINYIEYPSTITYVGYFLSNFRNDARTSSGLIPNYSGYIVIKAISPPTTNEAFSYTTNSATCRFPAAIYVPDNSVDAYKTSTQGQWAYDVVRNLIKPMSEMEASVRALGTVTEEDINRV